MENIYPEIVKEKSDEELLTMVYHYRQWETDIFIEAESELKRRGILPDEIVLQKKMLIEKEHAELSTGRKADWAGQVLGWIGIFGILGIIIGYHHSFGKVKAKYTDKTYFKYDESSGENGRYTFYVALITHTLWFLNKFLTYLQYWF